MKSLHISGRLAVAGALAALLFLGGFGRPVTAAPSTAGYGVAVQKAAAWVAAQQQPDGSFPGFGVGSTADAVVGLAAAGAPANPSRNGSPTALDFLAGKAPTYVKSPGAAAKIVLAILAADPSRDVHNFGGVDLLKAVNDGYDQTTGHYGKDVTGHALVILALSGLGQPVPDAAVKWLLGALGTDGGWAFDGSGEAGKADTNTTGLALQALQAAGQNGSPVLHKGLNYLSAQQMPDGGFPYQKAPGTASDANSTAFAVMGLQAIGGQPDQQSWQQGGVLPRQFLVQLQNASGALRYQASAAEDNPGATYQALPALAGAVLPIRGTGTSAPGAGGGNTTGGPGPGMPRTGANNELPYVAVLLLAAAFLIATGGRLAVARVRR